MTVELRLCFENHGSADGRHKLPRNGELLSLGSGTFLNETPDFSVRPKSRHVPVGTNRINGDFRRGNDLSFQSDYRNLASP